MYACLFEAVYDVTTVPSHLKEVQKLANSKTELKPVFSGHAQSKMCDECTSKGTKSVKLSADFLGEFSFSSLKHNSFTHKFSLALIFASTTRNFLERRKSGEE